MRRDENIVLIGMPGAGKSTVGVVLAKHMGRRFLDSDLVIQEKTGKLLHEIIVKVNGLVPQPTLYQSVNFRAFDARLKGVVPSATGYVDFHRCYWEA